MAFDVASINGVSIPINFNAIVMADYFSEKSEKYREQIRNDAQKRLSWGASSKARETSKEANREPAFERPSTWKWFLAPASNLKEPESDFGGMYVQVGSTSSKTSTNFSPDSNINIILSFCWKGINSKLELENI